MFLPGEWHGKRSLEGYGSWGWTELHMTERQQQQQHRAKTPNKWKMLAFFILEKTTVWKKWGEAHQETTWDQIKGMQALHTLWFQHPCAWIIVIKLTRSFLMVIHHFWGAWVLCVPLCLAKQWNYSFLYFTLSLRSGFVPVHRVSHIRLRKIFSF